MSIAGVGVVGLALAPAAHAVMPSRQGGGLTAGHQATTYHYVTDSLVVPSDRTSKHTGFDLNGDHKVDNQVAEIFAAFSESDVDFGSLIRASLTSGQVVMLHSLRTTSLAHSKNATWLVFAGKAKAHPVPTGGGKFRVDPSAPTSTSRRGKINHGTFLATRGSIPLQLALVPGQAPVELKVIDAHLQTRCSAKACTDGRLGGAITVRQLNTELIPAFAAEMSVIIAQSCLPSSPDTCSQEAQTIRQIFDTNNDYVISPEELRSNSLLQAVFAPDLDLFKANGHRGSDGKADSLSIGFGYHAVQAIFRQP